MERYSRISEKVQLLKQAFHKLHFNDVYDIGPCLTKQLYVCLILLFFRDVSRQRFLKLFRRLTPI